MNFLDPKIETYANKHSQNEPPVLEQLNRETNAKVLYPRMLAGHFQGRVLSMIAQMIGPKYILEIGTYTGYSAICFSEGLQEQGKIYTIDVNEELEDLVRSYIKKQNIEDKVELLIGNAIDIIPNLPIEKMDLVFIDADKTNYLNYYHLLLPRLKKGAFIIADNVLWSGKVADNTINDEETKALRDFNLFIQNDNRVQNVLLPIRDGLMILRKL